MNVPVLRRNLSEMTKRRHDLVIIGGGITGAAIAWDASLRGLRVALVEKRDFASETSAASSKLIHGGLRYLRNLEFSLVRESLRERRIWTGIAPHMVEPVQFVLPVQTARQKLTLRAGLMLYDALSFDRNRLSDPDKMLPRHGALSPQETLAAEPVLHGAARAGALTYYDCMMHAPERLAFEFIQGAVENGALVANYARALRLTGTADQVDGIRIRDLMDGREYDISARLVINAAGPWADHIADDEAHGAVKLQRSKGIHLITRRISRKALTLFLEDGHFFVLPWRGHSLLATTDTPYLDDPDAVRVNEADITELLSKVNRGLPEARLNRADIRHCYAGLRPLVADPAGADIGESTYGVSRGSEIFDHQKAENRAGLISALGGKWTTSRHLAEQVTDLALRKLGRPKLPCRTEHTPLPGGHMKGFADFVQEAQAAYPAHDPALIRHLALNYGARLHRLMEVAAAAPALATPLAPGLPEIGAQIHYAAKSELALTLEDAVFRRSGLCALGHPGQEALARAAQIMGGVLGWDAPETARQIEAAGQRCGTSVKA